MTRSITTNTTVHAMFIIEAGVYNLNSKKIINTYVRVSTASTNSLGSKQCLTLTCWWCVTRYKKFVFQKLQGSIGWRNNPKTSPFEKANWSPTGNRPWPILVRPVYQEISQKKRSLSQSWTHGAHLWASTAPTNHLESKQCLTLTFWGVMLHKKYKNWPRQRRSSIATQRLRPLQKIEKIKTTGGNQNYHAMVQLWFVKTQFSITYQWRQWFSYQPDTTKR